MNRVTQDEILTYLDIVSQDIFNKNYEDLSKTNKFTLRVNLKVRKDLDEIPDDVYRDILEYMDS